MPAHTGTVLVAAAEMRIAAHQLAEAIEHDYVELSDTQRCDLRLLPCELLRWADALDPERAPAVTADDGVVVRFRKPDLVRAIEEVGR